MESIEALHVTLQQSFSPDANLRVPAEETIKNLKHIPGSTVMLLTVAAEHQVQFEVRQAAAIQLKNIVRSSWVERVSVAGVPLPPINGDSAPALLSEEDKAKVRTNLIDALLAEPHKSVRDLFAETLHHTAIHDFPDNWPNLLPSLLNCISQSSNNDALRVHNALLALRKLCKRYEYKSKEQRGPLNDIVVQTFPLLLPLAQHLIASEQSLEAAMMLKQILKIFWSSTQFYLPSMQSFAQPDALQPWFDVLTAVMSKPLPEASTGLPPLHQPTTIEERNAWPWWKVKKWAIQIMSRLFSRYGIPSYAEDEMKDFATHFSTVVAPAFLGPVCETLNLRPSGQFCTDRVVHLCLTYVDLAVELAPTYKMLKPHMDFLLFKVCFPTLCLTTEDIELFETDPHEFVHKQNSPMADFYDPAKSAISLMMDLVKHRGKDVTQMLLQFLMEILHRYNATEESKRNHAEKDGALLSLGSLASYLLKKKKYSQDLEGLMVTSVFGDFQSNVAFLRCRACWMTQRFASIEWTDVSHLQSLIQLVLQRLNDPALPVQIEASKALRFLIVLDGAETSLLPVLPQLLHEYFRIMNEIGNDEVVSALQVIIEKFGDHIEPHAVELVTRLTNSFQSYLLQGNDDDDDDAAMAAGQCLDCVSTVLKGVCDRPEIFRSMEPQLVPLIVQILGANGECIEYLEFALDILTFLTYFPEKISPELWQAFPLIYLAHDQYACDYLNAMVAPIQNFIGRDPHVFLTGSAAPAAGGPVMRYTEMVLAMVIKTMQNEGSSDGECRMALSLFMCMLLNCRGQLDEYMSMINDLALGKLGQQVGAEIPTTRIAVFEVLGAALYYNPQLELEELERRSVTQQVFTQWILDSAHMERWLPRKLTVLGIASVLQVPTAAIPASINQSIPQLISAAVKVAELMTEDSEKEDQDDDDGHHHGHGGGGGFGGVHEDHDDDDDGGFDENEDVTNEVHEAYRKALTDFSTVGNTLSFLMGGDWGDEDDDLDDTFFSPIDDLDHMVFLSDTLHGAFAREPEVYGRIQAALPPETVAGCQKVTAAANEARAAAGQHKPAAAHST